MARTESVSREVPAALGIFVFTVAVFWLATLGGFVDIDDQLYLTENPRVQHGLTWSSIQWAFTAGHASNWHPLTWLVHMANWMQFGARAAGHHAISVLLHALNSALVLVVLHRSTLPHRALLRRQHRRMRRRAVEAIEERIWPDTFWPCVLVALLFAVHPLRVESVAWASELKDVLATFWWLVATWLYVRYSHRPESWGRYALVTVALVLGLLCKPMLVTWPVAMLIFDFWPLQRNHSAEGVSPREVWTALLLEKIPWFLLSAALAVVTLVVQSKSGAVMNSGAVPRVLQLANVFLAYGAYIRLTFLPLGLAFFYPMPIRQLEAWSFAYPPVILGVVLLGMGFWLGWRLRRRRPWFLAGWLWFVITLVPVVGIVKVGDQALADRYTYLPQIGLLWIMAWSLGELVEKRKNLRNVAVGCSVAVIVVFSLLTVRQIATWRDTNTLAEHALQVTSGNYVAHYLLGVADMESGHSTTAVEHFRAAEEVNHYYFPAIYDLATILVSDGKFEQASKRFDRLISEQPNFYGGYAGRAVVEARRGRLSLAEEAIRKARALAPSEPKVLVSEGDILAARGKRDEAADAYAQAIELDPQLAVAQAHLAALRLEEGRLTEAAEAAMRAVGLAPHEPQGYLLAARAYQQRNQYEQAVAILREALAKIPHLMEAANDLAWILATHPDAQIRNGAEAVDWAEQASSAAGGRDFARLDTLAAALAEQGRWEEAEAAAQRALELANQAVDSRAIEEITSRLQLYRQRQPFRTS